MKNEDRFYIRILSPVHVGCDEVYEPMGFVVDEMTATLTAFDPLDFFRALPTPDREWYASISRKGTIVSLLELYKFMKGKHFPGHVVRMSKGLVEHYRQTLSMTGDERKIQQELNNFAIARTAFNPHSNRPYIPGSAIKGALRTAYLNHLAKGKTVKDDHGDRHAAQTLEKQLLQYDKLEKDPFRLLKVSDFMPVQATTKIVYAVNEKKTSSNFPPRGPYQILEIIEPGAVFMGTVTIENRYTKEADIKQPLTAAALFESVDAFYTAEMQREKDQLQGVGLPFPKTDYPDSGWPLRIGRHSGAESVTIKDHRDIKIMQDRGDPPIFSKIGATTFWLAAESARNYEKSQLQPFGWATLGRMTEELIADFDKWRAEEQAVHPSVPQVAVSPTVAQITAVRPAEPIKRTWPQATVVWRPNDQTLIATVQGEKPAQSIQMSEEEKCRFVPEQFHKKLFQRRESVKVDIVVEPVGNAFRIVKVE
jgi:CRISPR-associated protein Csm5